MLNGHQYQSNGPVETKILYISNLTQILEYIVICQRVGVSNEPPWLQAATKQSACTEQITYVKYLDRANLVVTKEIKKRMDRACQNI